MLYSHTMKERVLDHRTIHPPAAETRHRVNDKQHQHSLDSEERMRRRKSKSSLCVCVCVIYLYIYKSFPAKVDRFQVMCVCVLDLFSDQSEMCTMLLAAEQQ